MERTSRVTSSWMVMTMMAMEMATVTVTEK
jgi:hypothetical protein